MPLEINEVAIRMRVAEGDERRADRSAASSAEEGCRDAARQEIVDDCVRLVLKALQAQDHR
jgi:hypothetical protein